MFVVWFLLLRVQVYVCCCCFGEFKCMFVVWFLLLRVQVNVCCLVVVESSSVCLLFGFCC